MNGRIGINELAQRREEILSGISTRNECWEICSNPDDLSQPGFVLGPPDLLNTILGLVDEEYGWPVSVDADAPIETFRPGLRRHPFIVREQHVIAIAVSMDEYRDIRRSLGLEGEQQEQPETNYPTDRITVHRTKHPDDSTQDKTP